jgi:hypothetical protein
MTIGHTWFGDQSTSAIIMVDLSCTGFLYGVGILFLRHPTRSAVIPDGNEV